MREITLGLLCVVSGFMGCNEGRDGAVIDAPEEIAEWEADASKWAESYGATDAEAAAACSGIALADRSFGKQLALTFDDGPKPGIGDQIVATLRKHGVRGTFFVNGYRFRTEQAWALARMIGHAADVTLGNHTENHQDMRRLTPAQVAQEMAATTSRIVTSTDGRKPLFFRFPWGLASCQNLQAVREAGMRTVGWNIDSADWCFAAGGGYCAREMFAAMPDAYRGDMVGYVMAQARSQQGGIVLFHETRYTASRLSEIITRLKAEGFRFTGIGDPQVFPRLNEVRR